MDPTLQAQLLATQAQADLALLTAAYNAGVASVQSPTGDVTAAQDQLDIQAAVAQAIAPLNSQISALQLAKSQEDQILAQVQTSVQALVALLNPVPAPAAPAPTS